MVGMKGRRGRRVTMELTFVVVVVMVVAFASGFFYFPTSKGLFEDKEVVELSAGGANGTIMMTTIEVTVFWLNETDREVGLSRQQSSVRRVPLKSTIYFLSSLHHFLVLYIITIFCYFSIITLIQHMIRPPSSQQE